MNLKIYGKSRWSLLTKTALLIAWAGCLLSANYMFISLTCSNRWSFHTPNKLDVWWGHNLSQASSNGRVRDNWPPKAFGVWWCKKKDNECAFWHPIILHLALRCHQPLMCRAEPTLLASELRSLAGRSLVHSVTVWRPTTCYLKVACLFKGTEVARHVLAGNIVLLQSLPTCCHCLALLVSLLFNSARADSSLKPSITRGACWLVNSISMGSGVR